LGCLCTHAQNNCARLQRRGLTHASGGKTCPEAAGLALISLHQRCPSRFIHWAAVKVRIDEISGKMNIYLE
jgi:hypothetical protein